MITFVTVWLCSAFMSELSLNVFVVFSGVLLIIRYIQIWRLNKRLPPGPWGVPVLGSLPFVKGDLHLYFKELASKYGSLFSLKLGSKNIVVMSDYKAIRDAFRREEFTGRPITEFTSILGGYGELVFGG